MVENPRAALGTERMGSPVVAAVTEGDPCGAEVLTGQSIYF